MKSHRRGTVTLALLASALLFGAAGFAAGMRADPQQGVLRNGRWVQDPVPALPDAGAQRNQMIASLKAIEERLEGMQRSLDAIERHERNTYVLLGNQKVASPNE